jgi:hypothetical protein
VLRALDCRVREYCGGAMVGGRFGVTVSGLRVDLTGSVRLTCAGLEGGSRASRHDRGREGAVSLLRGPNSRTAADCRAEGRFRSIVGKGLVA